MVVKCSEPGRRRPASHSERMYSQSTPLASAARKAQTDISLVPLAAATQPVADADDGGRGHRDRQGQADQPDRIAGHQRGRADQQLQDDQLVDPPAGDPRAARRTPPAGWGLTPLILGWPTRRS